MDLTTLSSLRARQALKTVVKCTFLSWPSDPFVTSCVSDAQNRGSSLRARRTFKTVVKCMFLTGQRWKSVVRWTFLTRTEADYGGKLKWMFLTRLNRTTVETCGKMDVFDRTEP